uniref:Uncharacterized protein n=1 Tax=Geospiza parvula TaxID=87175 RepID=A0A8U8B7D7_GEOPR
MDTHQGLDMKKRAGQANGHRGVVRARAGPRETSAASGGPCPGAGGGAASGVWRARKRQAGEEKPQEPGAGGAEGGGTSRLCPRPPAPEPPCVSRRRSEPGPQPRALNESETRGCRRRGGAGSGLATGEGGRGGEARRQEAPRSGWSWEDAAAAAAATSPKGPGARRTLPAPGGIRLR